MPTNTQPPLLSLIPETHCFWLGKLYEGIYWQDPDADLYLRSLRSACLAVKTALESRYTAGCLPGTADVLRRIDYIVDRLQQWIDTGTLYQNDDAEVFLDALSAHWAKLTGMLRELDDPRSPI